VLLADAHVHIYGCFNLEVFFDSAYANFRAEAVRQGCQNDFTGILLLAETSKDNWFQALVEYSDKKINVGPWTIHRTEENSSLWAQRNEKQALWVIAGRQIVTCENLEVLALMTASGFRDGHGILGTIEQVKGQGGIPVIPWGPGKWLGRRGKMVEDVIEARGLPAFFLGDNGNRPALWLRPRLFSLAEQRGIAVLPGSDPLPFSSENRRPGSFGFFLTGAVNPQQPGTDLKKLVLNEESFLKVYGRLEKPVRFMRNQLKMQLSKRFGRGK
jgi:hypothetical protein